MFHKQETGTVVYNGLKLFQCGSEVIVWLIYHVIDVALVIVAQ